MHDDVKRILEELEAADRDAQALLLPLRDAQANWQPREGRGWSVVQCLDHLATAATTYLVPMAEAADRARAASRLRRGPIAPGWFARWFIAELEPPPKRRFPAPPKIQPVSRLDRDAALSRFLDAQRMTRERLGAWADLDLQGVRFSNPLAPIRFTLGTGFRIIAAHDRRHLWQARQVTQQPDFPRS